MLNNQVVSFMELLREGLVKFHSRHQSHSILLNCMMYGKLLFWLKDTLLELVMTCIVEMVRFFFLI
jgi:hypothetical protein